MAGASGTPKKSKLEKICELQASLKIANEESRRLRKELHVLREAGPGGSYVPTTKNMGDPEKMKVALKALRRVTVTQEMNLNSMRSKAQQRRKDLKEKDALIAKLHRQVKSLQKTQKALEGGNGDGDLLSKFIDIQQAFFEEESKNIKLEEELAEKDNEIRNLSKKISSPIVEKEGSNHSFRSIESSSTQSEFDTVKLKKELADQTNQIAKLQMSLELAHDELHELRKKKSNTECAEAFPAFRGEGSDPFANVAPEDEYSDAEEEEDDDFW